MDIGSQNPSTRSVREKEHALASANNIKESKFGGAILNCRNSARQLGREMGRLDKEFKRKQMHIDQEKKRFLQQINIPEPMMILARPASSDALQRRYRNQESPDENKPEIPGYMKPIKWRVKTASTLSTIDVFHVKVRKKLNVWDMAMLEVDKPHFQAKVVPSMPLTADEEKKLSYRRTSELNQRPWSSSGKARLLGRADNNMLKVKKDTSKIKMSSPSPSSPETTTTSREKPAKEKNEIEEVKENKDCSDQNKVFVTELPVIREQTEDDITTEKLNRNVTFADKVETFPVPEEDDSPEGGAPIAQTKSQNSCKKKPSPYRRATTPKKTTNRMKKTPSPAHDTRYRKEIKAKKMSKS